VTLSNSTDAQPGAVSMGHALTSPSMLPGNPAQTHAHTGLGSRWQLLLSSLPSGGRGATLGSWTNSTDGQTRYVMQCPGHQSKFSWYNCQQG
jgi:hypothetical protein